jgi:hypothetical protein
MPESLTWERVLRNMRGMTPCRIEIDSASVR